MLLYYNVLFILSILLYTAVLHNHSYTSLILKVRPDQC